MRIKPPISKVNFFFLEKKYIYLQSSSYHAVSTDLPGPLSPPVSIVHRSREVFKAPSCIGTEQLYIGSSKLFKLCSSVWRGPPECIAYEFVLTYPAVSRISFNLDSFRDGWNRSFFFLIQFSISTQFKCQNGSISNNSV